LKRSLLGKKMPKIANRYLLNTGHVAFFYNKQRYLADRYVALVQECNRRGFTTNNPFHRVDWGPFGSVDQIDWKPDALAIQINLTRIVARVAEKHRWYRYKGRLVSHSWYIHALRRRGHRL
jgi:deoxyribonuclease (pyrimidine dimer)